MSEITRTCTVQFDPERELSIRRRLSIAGPDDPLFTRDDARAMLDEIDALRAQLTHTRNLRTEWTANL